MNTIKLSTTLLSLAILATLSGCATQATQVDTHRVSSNAAKLVSGRTDTVTPSVWRHAIDNVQEQQDTLIRVLILENGTRSNRTWSDMDICPTCTATITYNGPDLPVSIRVTRIDQETLETITRKREIL